jgi:hypothetical protein
MVALATKVRSIGALRLSNMPIWMKFAISPDLDISECSRWRVARSTYLCLSSRRQRHPSSLGNPRNLYWCLQHSLRCLGTHRRLYLYRIEQSCLFSILSGAMAIFPRSIHIRLAHVTLDIVSRVLDRNELKLYTGFLSSFVELLVEHVR